MHACRPFLLAALLAIPLATPLAAQEAATTFPFARPEPPCTVWGPPDQPGGKPVCRRRAQKPSEMPISCRLMSNMLDQETGNKMCVYRRPGLSGDETTVSVPAATPCAMAIKC